MQEEKPTHIYEYYNNNLTPLITLDGIHLILEDEDVFYKFVHYDENKDFFGKISQGTIARNVKRYVELIKNQGAIISQDVEGRLKIIERFIPPYMTNNHITFKEYGGINKKELYDVAMMALGSIQELQDFLQCQTELRLYHNISPALLLDYMSNELSRSIESIAISEQVYLSLNFIRHRREWLPEEYYKVDMSKKLDPEFEASVLQSVSEDGNPINLALDIYNGLNRNVKYNNAINALGQDIENNQEAQEIYEKGIEEITLADNRVICKQWAELYAYFMEKKGFDAYVCGSDAHKWVVAFKGTNMIYADATEPTQSLEDTAYLMDITRSKLGVRPAGFIARSFSGNVERIDSLKVIDLEYDRSKFEENEAAQAEVRSLISLIEDDRDLSRSIMGWNDPTNCKSIIIKKLGFINSMVQKYKLDNTDAVGYVYNLVRNFFSITESKYVGWTNIFYQGNNTDGCNMVPIITLKENIGYPDYIKFGCLYFVFDPQENKILPIARAELKKRVATGLYVQGIGEMDNRRVPGIPEITDPDWVVRNRAKYLMSKNSEKTNPNEIIERIGEE